MQNIPSFSLLHSYHMRRYWFYVKNDFSNFYKISTFWDALSQKKWFLRRCLFVVVVVVCKHDNFRRNYQIELKFVTTFEGPKRKNEFFNKPFLTMVLVLSIKNVFVKIKNSIFSQKYMRYGKNFEKKNSSFQKDLQICFWSFFQKSYIFFINEKYD